jgi:hypothetical protein
MRESGAPIWSVAAACLLLTLLFFIFVLLPVSALREKAFLDFYDYYFAARAVAQASDPYDAAAADALARAAGVPLVPDSDYIYPLPFAVALVPLTLLAPFPAACGWYVVSAISLILAARRLVSIGVADASGGWRGTAMLACIAFPPVVSTLCMGQVNGVVLWLLLLATGSWALQRERAAGVFIGVAAVIKLFPAALLLLAVARRQWVVLAAAVTTGGALFGMAELLSPGSSSYFLRTVLPGLSLYRDHHAHPGNQSLRGVLLRLFCENPWTRPYVSASASAIEQMYLGGVLVLGLATLSIVARSLRAPEAESQRFLQVGLIVTASLLASPLGWESTATLLLLPMTALLRAGRVRAVLGIYLLFVVQRLFDPFMIDPAAWPWVRTHPLAPNASFLATLFCFWCCARELVRASSVDAARARQEVA